MKTPNWAKFIITVIGSQLAGLIGAIFTNSKIPTWYAGLAKPSISPPNWVFGPVWTILYILMGIAAFLVWKQGWERKEVKVALILFLIQLGLNSLWSFIFFGQHNPGAAFIEIIIMWFAIAATIFAFAKVSKLAAWLMVPYLAWVSFASYLNYMIYSLN